MNVPKLRFKEFNDEWTKYKLNDFLDLLTDYDANGSFADMANNVKTYDTQNYAWYVRATDLENNSPLDKVKYTDKKSYDFLKKTALYGDEVLMAKRGNIGNVYYFKSKTKYATLGPNCYLLKTNNKIDNYFLYSYFKSTNGYKKLNRLNASSTLGALYKDDVKNINLIFPNKKEQRKISRTLELLDKKIELQSKKIEDLKLFKKGLILSLKKNSFDWHTVCIKDLFKITRGVVIPKNELSEFKSGEYKYPVYSSQTSNQGVLGYSDTFDFNGKYLTWTTDGANAGKVFYRNGKFRCTNVCGVLYEDNIRFTNELFAELLNYETPKHVSYVGNPKLMNNIMANIKIKIPSNEIQENISLVINTINHKVNLETNKLLKLKELKKGLMQSMFV